MHFIGDPVLIIMRPKEDSRCQGQALISSVTLQGIPIGLGLNHISKTSALR